MSHLSRGPRDYSIFERKGELDLLVKRIQFGYPIAYEVKVVCSKEWVFIFGKKGRKLDYGEHLHEKHVNSGLLCEVKESTKLNSMHIIIYDF